MKIFQSETPGEHSIILNFSYTLNFTLVGSITAEIGALYCKSLYVLVHVYVQKYAEAMESWELIKTIGMVSVREE